MRQATYRKTEPGDLKALIDKKATTFLGHLTPEQASGLEKLPHTFSVLVDGEVRLCGGVVEYWPGRGEAWAILAPDTRHDFLAIHHAVRDFLKNCPVRRIEASVEYNFRAGHRWVRALGFSLDAACLKAFLPDGKDASLYSRIKKDA